MPFIVVPCAKQCLASAIISFTYHPNIHTHIYIYICIDIVLSSMWNISELRFVRNFDYNFAQKSKVNAARNGKLFCLCYAVRARERVRKRVGEGGCKREKYILLHH